MRAGSIGTLAAIVCIAACSDFPDAPETPDGGSDSTPGPSDGAASSDVAARDASADSLTPDASADAGPDSTETDGGPDAAGHPDPDLAVDAAPSDDGVVEDVALDAADTAVSDAPVTDLSVEASVPDMPVRDMRALDMAEDAVGPDAVVEQDATPDLALDAPDLAVHDADVDGGVAPDGDVDGCAACGAPTPYCVDGVVLVPEKFVDTPQT